MEHVLEDRDRTDDNERSRERELVMRQKVNP